MPVSLSITAASTPQVLNAAFGSPNAVASASPTIPWLPADASWLSILQGCIPVVIAAIVAWVGYRQLATASAKLKLDLFEKRLAIFDMTWSILSMASTEKIIDPHDLAPLANAIPEAAFLFGSHIEDYLDGIRNRITEQQIRLLKAHLEGPYASEELRAEITDSKQWFIEECSVVQRKFAPYLNFEKWR